MQAGNAVPQLMAKAIAHSIFKGLDKHQINHNNFQIVI